MDIREQLFEMRDIGYRDFQSKLIPNIDKEKIIGVRTPELRRFAKNLKGSDAELQFLRALPHEYYDEDNLHGMLISMEKDYCRAIALLDEFLPFVDNWATCDLISPRSFFAHKGELILKIEEWMSSDHTYEVRFAIGMLLKFFLDEDFSKAQADSVAAVCSAEYYINMMRAWYFATALAKQYDRVIGYVEDHRLDVWTHNMTIRKATESYRITAEQKEYLKGLRNK